MQPDFSGLSAAATPAQRGVHLGSSPHQLATSPSSEADLFGAASSTYTPAVRSPQPDYHVPAPQFQDPSFAVQSLTASQQTSARAPVRGAASVDAHHGHSHGGQACTHSHGSSSTAVQQASKPAPAHFDNSHGHSHAGGDSHAHSHGASPSSRAAHAAHAAHSDHDHHGHSHAGGSNHGHSHGGGEHKHVNTATSSAGKMSGFGSGPVSPPPIYRRPSGCAHCHALRLCSQSC